MISLRGLTKRFGGKVAVDDLTVDIQPGRVTGFLGPNGAGKSTTLRMILGLDAPTSGTALVNGVYYPDLPRPLCEVGALLDARAAHPGRSAGKHLLAMARSNGIPTRRVEEVLAEVGLSDVAGKRVGTFSLGMSQRLGIAGALLGDPPALLFDEPVNGLDLDGVRWIRDLMRSLADEGRTVLVSSHLMSEMQITAHRLVIIGKGRLLAEAPMEEFVLDSSQETVEVRLPEPADVAALERRVLAAGGQVVAHGPAELVVRGLRVQQVGDLAHEVGARLHGLGVTKRSLEDAYLQLTESSVEFGVAAVR